VQGIPYGKGVEGEVHAAGLIGSKGSHSLVRSYESLNLHNRKTELQRP